MPEEMVYDQDHLITVNENAGDLILTGDFQDISKNVVSGFIYAGKQTLKAKER
jgi:hypothetical protein